MATVPLVPGTINATIRRGAQQTFKSSAVVDFAAAAVDLSAWASFTAKLIPTSPSPTGAAVTFGTVTGDANGICTLVYDASDLATNPPGTANLIIEGVHVGGDDAQLLASGTAQLIETA